MKFIPVGKTQKAIVDDEDYEWLKDLKSWTLFNNGYAVLHKGNGWNRSMHRLVMFAQQGQEIDHINGNRLDNRKCNLRFVTRQQNLYNKKKRNNTSSIYKGVS